MSSSYMTYLVLTEFIMGALVIDITNIIHTWQTYAIICTMMNTVVNFVELLNIHAN